MWTTTVTVTVTVTMTATMTVTVTVMRCYSHCPSHYHSHCQSYLNHISSIHPDLSEAFFNSLVFFAQYLCAKRPSLIMQYIYCYYIIIITMQADHFHSLSRTMRANEWLLSGNESRGIYDSGIEGGQSETVTYICKCRYSDTNILIILLRLFIVG